MQQAKVFVGAMMVMWLVWNVAVHAKIDASANPAAVPKLVSRQVWLALLSTESLRLHKLLAVEFPHGRCWHQETFYFFRWSYS